MTKNYVVITMYKFVSLTDYRDLQPKILAFCKGHHIKGTLLLAEEGINGTVVGKREHIDAFLFFLKSDDRLADLEYQASFSDECPFLRTKVKLKKEIVTLRQAKIDPKFKVGTYVEPKDWNTVISDPKTVLIDTRNHYEYQIGTFKNAISPDTTVFHEFPTYVKETLDPKKNKKLAMFCTGGIRCEKATSYMLEQGFEQVYHLKGGILKYLKEINEDESLWEGECFVFDSRVSVNHKLEKGSYEQCFACRRPISYEDIKSIHYQKGVSCPYCFNETTEIQRASFKERQRQVELARQRKQLHIGAAIP